MFVDCVSTGESPIGLHIRCRHYCRPAREQSRRWCRWKSPSRASTSARAVIDVIIDSTGDQLRFLPLHLIRIVRSGATGVRVRAGKCPTQTRKRSRLAQRKLRYSHRELAEGRSFQSSCKGGSDRPQSRRWSRRPTNVRANCFPARCSRRSTPDLRDKRSVADPAYCYAAAFGLFITKYRVCPGICIAGVNNETV